MFKDYVSTTITKPKRHIKGTKNYVILEEFMNTEKPVMIYTPETVVKSPYRSAWMMNGSAKRFGFPVKIVVRNKQIIFIRKDIEIKYPELL